MDDAEAQVWAATYAAALHRSTFHLDDPDSYGRAFNAAADAADAAVRIFGARARGIAFPEWRDRAPTDTTEGSEED